ncbi:MAG: tetratricopeptide repeat protein [Spirochaetia bacterium]|jgi:tetratricopeptide (TPR) repeat protein
MMKRIAIACALLIAATAAFGASEFFDKGEALFVQDKPQDARPLLESALTDDPNNEKTYLYLGIIYQQLGDAQKAIAILKRGLAIASAYKELFYYNMGNNYFSQKEYSFAEEMYTNAVSVNKNLAPGYLNRANSRLQLQNLDGALADYTLFLQLAPNDAQRPNIEKVIGLIRQVQDDQEKARQAEAARQQALLNDVTNSLNSAGDATKNLSVESINGQTDPVNVDIKD